MKKKHLLISFIILYLFSAALPWLDAQYTGHAGSFTWDALAPTPMERLKKTLKYVGQDYVDPQRVSAKEMYKACLEKISLAVPEIRVFFEGSDKAILAVVNQRKQVSLGVKDLNQLYDQLVVIERFIKEHKTSTLKDDLIESTFIDALLATLDPHSMFLTQELYQETQVGTQGHFGGLGIIIGIRNSKLTIIAPLEDTPASRAKLKSNDTIVKINDEATDNMPLTEAVKRMRGPIGTKVTISISRKGWAAPEAFTLVRDKIIVVSVESFMLPGNVGYVRVKNFQQDTGKSLAKHLKDLQSQAHGSLKGLVVDLRNNPGGILDQAIDVSDQFLTHGAIVSTKGPGGVEFAKEDASSKGLDPQLPIVTIVNHGSASASEIVAGALQGNTRSLVLGSTTFGKGTVQRIYGLPNESALKLTIAKYYTPGGVSIQSTGIIPHIETTPYIISKNGYNLILKEFKPGESTLEKHFDASVNGPKSAVLKPDTTIRYVDVMDEPGKKDEIQESSLKDEKRALLLKDFDVTLATQIITSTSSSQLKDMLQAAEKLQPQLAAEQSKKLVEALKEKGVDWTSDEKNPTVPKSCRKFKISSTLTDEAGKKIEALTAGAKASLEVSLTNTSKCNLDRILVQTESKRYFFDDLEFLFGKIKAGQTLTRKLAIETPQAMYSGLSEVDFTVLPNRDEVLFRDRKQIATKAVPTPVFALSYQVQEVIGSNSSIKAANGQLNTGDEARIVVNVKNTGPATSQQGAVSLQVPEGYELQGKNVHAAIHDLKAGDEKQFEFRIDVTSAAKAVAPLLLTVADYDFRVFQTQEIDLPIDQTLNSNKVVLNPPVVNADLSTLSNQVYSQQFVPVKGTVTDLEGLQDLYILCNNKKVYYQPLEGTSGKFQTTIPLEPGENQIAIVVRDKSELQVVERAIVIRKGSTAPLVSDDGETILE